MKIACISTSRVPSDTANSIQVMKACQALAKLGHQVHLLLPANRKFVANRKLVKRIVEWEELTDHYGLAAPFEITWLPAHPRLRHNDFAWEAVARARKTGADLIYTWTGQSAVFGLLAGFPVAYEVHDLPTGRLGPLWFRAFLRLPGKKRLLPITHALLGKLEGTYGAAAAGQTVVVPNGVDLEQYEGLPEAGTRTLHDLRSELGLPGKFTVLCAGHLYTGRGVELFLGLAQRFPQVSFVWVGGRPEEAEVCHAQAVASGIDNVIFTGFIAQRRLPCYQSAADVLLMPYARQIAGSGGGNSVEICSPMKMFDYLAAGRAILSSDLPVIREVLNEMNAVFAPPEDLDGWSAARGRLLEDEGLRRRLGEQGRTDAERYSWRARAERALEGFVG